MKLFVEMPNLLIYMSNVLWQGVLLERGVKCSWYRVGGIRSLLHAPDLFRKCLHVGAVHICYRELFAALLASQTTEPPSAVHEVRSFRVAKNKGINVSVLAGIEHVSHGRALDFVLVFAVCNSPGLNMVSKNDIIKDLRGIPFSAPAGGSRILYEWLTSPLSICS